MGARLRYRRLSKIARVVGSACVFAVGALSACSEAGSGPNASGFPPLDAAIPATDGGAGVDVDLGRPGDASLFEGGCATGTARAIHDPIYMLFVVDGSGSMNADSKWAALVPALDLLIDDLLLQKDTSFAIGLTIFSDTNDVTLGKGPYATVDVPVAYVDSVQAAKLHARLDNAKPRYDTPTLAVLNGQFPVIESFVPAPPLVPGGKRVVAFMTDGVPYPDPNDTQKPLVVKLVGDEFAKVAPAGPITTVAVGIGYFLPYSPTTYDPTFMGNVALAGGVPNQPCYPEITQDPSQFCHFQVTPGGGAFQLENEFRIAFDKIRSRVASCEFALEKADGGSPVEPDKANVVFTDDYNDQSIVPEDPQDGWTYDDANNPTKIILHGKSCAALKANVRGQVQVVLGCKTVVR
jgi:hypothetical protein